MKYKSYIYRRKKYSQRFFRLLLIDRILIKKDNIIIITGGRGSGKSTLGLKLLLGFSDEGKVPFTQKLKDFEDYFNQEMNSYKQDKKDQEKVRVNINKFVMEEGIVATRKGLHNACRNTRRGFIQADEAVVSVARRNAMTKANKILHEILTINRKNFNTIVFCIPSIEDFDISILQYASHWLHIDRRGLAALLLPQSTGLFGRKRWDVDKMKKIVEKFVNDNPTISESDIPYWLFDNFRGYLKWNALPEKVEAKYNEIIEKQKNIDTEELDSGKEKKTRGLGEEQLKIIEKIVKELQKGKITDTADYYAYCGDLDFKKDKLNREVNEFLAKHGDGRTVLRIIKENKEKEEERFDNEENKTKIIY